MREALQRPFAIQMLFASLLVYLKYQIVNHQVLNKSETKAEVEQAVGEGEGVIKDFSLYQLIATIIYVFLSFIAAFFRSGRRIFIIYCVLGTCWVFEIVLTMSTIIQKNSDQKSQWIENMELIKAILIFILYFTVC